MSQGPTSWGSAPHVLPPADVPGAAFVPEGAAIGLTPEAVADSLLATPFFAGRRREEFGASLARIIAYECEEGATLLAAGVANGAVGVLVRGSASVIAAGWNTPVTTLDGPDLFGELAFLQRVDHRYSVIATTKCWVIWIPDGAAAKLAGRIPVFAQKLQEAAAMRIKVLPAPPPSEAPLRDEEGDAAEELEPIDPLDDPFPTMGLVVGRSLAPKPPVVAPVAAPQPARPAAPAPGPARMPSLPGIPVMAPSMAPSAAPAPALQKRLQEVARSSAQIIPFVEVSSFDPQSVLGLMPPKMIRQHRILPLALNGEKLTVGMVTPRNITALAELKRSIITADLEIVAIAADDFEDAVKRFKIEDRPINKGEKKSRIGVNPDTITIEAVETERDAAPPPKTVGDDVIRLVNRIIATALDREASDIHIEPLAGGLRVRFRTNGLLEEWSETIPPTHSRGVLTRLKVLGGADITERRRPQDGRMTAKVGKREIDMRLSSMPSNRGEKIVLRILDSAAATRPLEQLFIDKRVLDQVRRALNRPYGGILIAGATGSGKTSSLYSMLHELMLTRTGKHVFMVEDPIEFRLEGVTQVQVDHSAGLDFATVLRSSLRQDPDVIVLGEIRDADSARIGLEAAMTGHLLLSSIHANAAVSAIERLEQVGCSRPLISQSLALVIVQRLVRRLCSACRKMERVPDSLIDSLKAKDILPQDAGNMVPHAVGCEACNRTGYVGRVAVIESLLLSDDIRSMIGAGESHASIQAYALETGAIVTFASSIAYLLNQSIIGPGEALLAVAD